MVMRSRYFRRPQFQFHNEPNKYSSLRFIRTQGLKTSLFKHVNNLIGIDEFIFEWIFLTCWRRLFVKFYNWLLFFIIFSKNSSCMYFGLKTSVCCELCLSTVSNLYTRFKILQKTIFYHVFISKHVKGTLFWNVLYTKS